MTESCGPDCGNICDVVYYLLCDDCEKENECHKNGIDHSYMIACALKYLTVKYNEEYLHPEKLITTLEKKDAFKWSKLLFKH